MPDSFFEVHANCDPQGWSPKRRFNHIEYEIRRLCGSKLRDFRFYGVYFYGSIDEWKDGQEPTPMILFPGSGQTGRPTLDSVGIALTDPCREDYGRACFQLAHECVHLLSPKLPENRRPRANVLEEGFATYFQIRYMRNEFSSSPSKSWMLSNSTSALAYERAAFFAEKLLAKDKFAIKKLRKKVPMISDFTDSLLMDTIGISKELAYTLCRPFYELS